jgi:hypothetical protein
MWTVPYRNVKLQPRDILQISKQSLRNACVMFAHRRVALRMTALDKDQSRMVAVQLLYGTEG